MSSRKMKLLKRAKKAGLDNSVKEEVCKGDMKKFMDDTSPGATRSISR